MIIPDRLGDWVARNADAVAFALIMLSWAFWFAFGIWVGIGYGRVQALDRNIPAEASESP